MKKISVIVSAIIVIYSLLAISVFADTPDPYLDLSGLTFDSEGNILTDENGKSVFFSSGYFDQYGVVVRSDKSAAVYGYKYIFCTEEVSGFDEYICSVYFSDELVEIEARTAEWFHNITKVRFGNRLQYIGENAFPNLNAELTVEGEKTDALLIIEKGNDGLLKNELFSVYSYVCYYSEYAQNYIMLENGEAYSGFYTYDGLTYYFDGGEFFTERVLILDGKRYYFDEEHHLIKNGLASSPDGIVYIVDGEPVKGFKELDGETYYFGSDGYIYEGKYLALDGKRYYFDEEHHLIKNGLVCSPDGIVYLVDTEPVKGFKEFDGETYYFGNDGYMYEGKYLTLDGKRYYFDEEHYLIKNGLVSSPDGAVYLVDAEPVKGFVEIGSETYYFGDDGYMFEGECKTIDGTEHYFSSDHSLANGIITVNGGKTIVKDGIPVGVGFVDYFGRTYYISKITGLLNEKTELTIGGVLHYFNSNYSLKNGLIYENGISRMYENGVMVKGAFRDLDGDGENDSYFLFSNGERVLCDKTIGGRDYRYESGKLVLKQGLCYEGGKYYYYEGGIKVGGYVNIGEKKYYFLRTTYEMVTSSSYIIGGYNREFNPDHSVKPISGWQTFGNDVYYFDNGEKVTGFKTIDGYTYYFMRSAEKYGAMASGWLTVGGRVYYFFREGSEKYGRMAIGTQTIGGIKYVFNSNGTINNGFISDSMGNVRYYYMSQELHGWYKIGDKTYYFTLVDGFMARGDKIIGGKLYYFDGNGALILPEYADANELTKTDSSFGDTFDGSSGGWGSVVFH